MQSIRLTAKTLASIFFIFIVVALASCLKDGDETIILEDGSDIPSDSKADPNPKVDNPNTYVPNFQYNIEQEGRYTIVRIDMTGIQDPQTLEWLRLIGTGGDKNGKQNVWLSIDGKPKGIAVYNNADDDNNKVIKADLVFLVDNSGSMNQEADAIARDIVSWATKLASSNLDIQFGCVGYDVNGKISGALNITDLEALSNYLNRSTGTSRTVGFAGSDRGMLEEEAYAYGSAGNECGVMALRFADDFFSFRTGANRIYTNFTDEPNQPGGKQGWSVDYVKDQQNWGTAKGTIHTVYSDDTIFTERPLYNEKPWKMSRYTGGTELYAPSNFNGVSLEKLPVTGAMQNSYVIRFTNIEEFMDGRPHTIKITVLSEDGSVRAEKTFTVTFSEKE